MIMIKVDESVSLDDSLINPIEATATDISLLQTALNQRHIIIHGIIYTITYLENKDNIRRLRHYNV